MQLTKPKMGRRVRIAVQEVSPGSKVTKTRSLMVYDTDAEMVINLIRLAIVRFIQEAP